MINNNAWVKNAGNFNWKMERHLHKINVYIPITFEEKPFQEMVKDLQKAMYTHQKRGGHSLVPVEAMKKFSQDSAPGLFQMILGSITTPSISTHRIALQEKRVCSVLHNLVYFRLVVFLD